MYYIVIFFLKAGQYTISQVNSLQSVLGCEPMFQFFFCVYLLAFTIVILAWDFWRLNFGQGIFGGVCLKP